VLARWHHPKRGLLEPAEFMAMAESAGMISELSFG
jgi:predicted signal transduction protein with EAL and GGDEF domain